MLLSILKSDFAKEAIMGKEAIKSIRYFMLGFRNAFSSGYEQLSFEKPGHYIKSVSKKRREKLIIYEKNRSRQENRKNKKIRV